MAENERRNSVASVAMVVILLITLAVGYFVFVRVVSAHRELDGDISVPEKIDRPIQK